MALDVVTVNAILEDLYAAKVRFATEWTRPGCKTSECVDFCMQIVLLTGKWTREQILEAWLYEALGQYMDAVGCPKMAPHNRG